jgi:hypothetical protein
MGRRPSIEPRNEHRSKSPNWPRPNSRVTSRQISDQARSRPESSPEPLEVTACDPCVMDRVLRISLPEVVVLGDIGEIVEDQQVIFVELGHHPLRERDRVARSSTHYL